MRVVTGGVGVCDDVHLFSFFFGDFFRGALCGGGGVASAFASSSSACFFFCLAALMGRPSIVVAASLKIVKGASSGLSSGDGWESFPRRVSWTQRMLTPSAVNISRAPIVEVLRWHALWDPSVIVPSG